MLKKTYLICRKGPGDGEHGPFNLLYKDTFYEDGHIEWSVVGTCNGEKICRSGVNISNGPINWDRLHKGRTSCGWLLHAEPEQNERISQARIIDEERHRARRESWVDKMELPWFGKAG